MYPIIKMCDKTEQEPFLFVQIISIDLVELEHMEMSFAIT